MNVFSTKLAAGGLALVAAGLAAGVGIGRMQSRPAEPVALAHEQRLAPVARATTAVCADCGVVESVRAVQRKGAGTGVGAVAGGVVGAALGNQVGKGGGRAAMTVLGAVGGGFAGNEVERRVRSETVYEMQVRMDDGSQRTVTQRESLAAGVRVAVQGSRLAVIRQ